MLLLFMILFPAAAGIAVSLIPADKISREYRICSYTAILAVTDIIALSSLFRDDKLRLFQLAGNLDLYFYLDGVGKFFICPVLLLYTLICFYAFAYMPMEGREESFFAFYFLSFGAVLAACAAGNLITLYLCFEFATLTSMPMVLHERTPDAILAALKYLFYSLGGALLGLLSIVALCYYGQEQANAFIPGGFLGSENIRERGILLKIIFAGIVGFGAKAGLYPMHGWLPAAHPIAPAPASALLSGIIAKLGVLAVLRLVFFSAGVDFLRGTWVQTAWICLSMLTIFMGSMMAWREKVLKKRLAYSSVSQIAYIMLGLSLLNEGGFTGGLIQLAAHAVSKSALFLCAGVFIFTLGKRQIQHLRGLGPVLPVTFWCFFIASLSLIGIPPMGGFVSKWHLALAALNNQDIYHAAFTILPPVILMISALLTAAYLLPVMIDAFFVPGQKNNNNNNNININNHSGETRKPSALMTAPMMILCAAALGVGLFGSGLAEIIRTAARGLF